MKRAVFILLLMLFFLAFLPAKDYSYVVYWEDGIYTFSIENKNLFLAIVSNIKLNSVHGTDIFLLMILLLCIIQGLTIIIACFTDLTGRLKSLKKCIK